MRFKLTNSGAELQKGPKRAILNFDKKIVCNFSKLSLDLVNI